MFFVFLSKGLQVSFPKLRAEFSVFEFFTSLSVLFVFSYYKTRKKLKTQNKNKKLRPDFWEAYY